MITVKTIRNSTAPCIESDFLYLQRYQERRRIHQLVGCWRNEEGRDPPLPAAVARNHEIGSSIRNSLIWTLQLPWHRHHTSDFAQYAKALLEEGPEFLAAAARQRIRISLTKAPSFTCGKYTCQDDCGCTRRPNAAENHRISQWVATVFIKWKSRLQFLFIFVLQRICLL